MGWRAGGHLRAAFFCLTGFYFEGRGPSGLKLTEIIDAEDGGNGFPHLGGGSGGPPPPPSRLGPKGPLPAEGRGTHGVRGAGEQQQQPQQRRRQAAVHGSPRVPRERPDGRPPSAQPAPELSAPRRGPGPGRPPRPEEPWLGPATRGGPGTAPSGRGGSAKPPGPLIRTRRCRRSSTQPDWPRAGAQPGRGGGGGGRARGPGAGSRRLGRGPEETGRGHAGSASTLQHPQFRKEHLAPPQPFCVRMGHLCPLFEPQCSHPSRHI